MTPVSEGPKDLTIRDATPADAAAISKIIVRNLSEVNAPDYSPGVLDKMIKDRTPKLIASRINRWQVIVATLDGAVAGTAALEANRLRMFFVSPDHHRTGIGSALLARIEALARQDETDRLEVASSLTAQRFYRNRGFLKIRDVVDGDHQTVLMRKPLTGTGSDIRQRLARSTRSRGSALRRDQ